MKYQLLDLSLLRKIYKKDTPINIYFVQGDPNDKNIEKQTGSKLTISQIIPDGDIREYKTITSKKFILHKDYLLGTKLPYNNKPNNKSFSLCCKLRYNINDTWSSNFLLQVCSSPLNVISNNCLSGVHAWIKVNNTNTKPKPIRKSPSESATLFNVGIIKVGNDGNKWRIVETKNKIKRWQKL